MLTSIPPEADCEAVLQMFWPNMGQSEELGPQSSVLAGGVIVICPPSAAGTPVWPPSVAGIPVDPIDPDDPIEPWDPVEFVGPVDPVEPLDPVAPLDPIDPPSAPSVPPGPAFCPLGVDVEVWLLLPLPPLPHAVVQSTIANDVLNHREGE